MTFAYSGAFMSQDNLYDLRFKFLRWRKTMKRFLMTLCAGFVLAVAAQAAVPVTHTSTPAVQLNGVFEQGGLVTGVVTPGSKVNLNGVALKVAPDGRFVAGLERHFPAHGTLKVVAPDGTVASQSFAVRARTYHNQAIHGVPPRTVNPPAADMPRIRRETQAIINARKAYTPYFGLQHGLKLPVNGPITGVYGSSRSYNGVERGWHKGVDLAAGQGAAVHAPAPGVICLVLHNSFFNGNLVLIDHGDELFSVYIHLNTIDVHEGQHVNTGDVIGHVGHTGMATGPHLHWGVYWRQQAIDPLLLVNKTF